MPYRCNDHTIGIIRGEVYWIDLRWGVSPSNDHIIWAISCKKHGCSFTLGSMKGMEEISFMQIEIFPCNDKHFQTYPDIQTPKKETFTLKSWKKKSNHILRNCKNADIASLQGCESVGLHMEIRYYCKTENFHVHENFAIFANIATFSCSRILPV